MTKLILFIDENETVLKSLPAKELADCELRLATSYSEAGRILSGKREVALLVAELNLNGEDGTAFLAAAKKGSPNTIRMVLTAADRFKDALDALNRGQAYKYIPKPCAPEDLLKEIRGGLDRHEEMRKERQAMRSTLMGSVKALADILDLVNPEAMGFARRIKENVLATGKALKVKSPWRLELAVMLSHIGCVALPSEIITKMDKGQSLSPEEKQIFGMHPSIACSLLENIDQMADVANIIRHQHDTVNDGQPLEARIIKAALDLDRMQRKGAPAEKILEVMRKKKDTYDPKVVAAMLGIATMTQTESCRNLSVDELEEGMVMAEDMVNNEGAKLLLRGQALSKASLMRLKAFHVSLGVIEPVVVMDNRATR